MLGEVGSLPYPEKRQNLNFMSTVAIGSPSSIGFLNLGQQLGLPVTVSLVNTSEKSVKKCRVMHVSPFGSRRKPSMLMKSRAASTALERSWSNAVAG